MKNQCEGYGMPIGQKVGYFENKTIIVFGGTGTIGSLIVEYLKTQNPHSIRIFSNDENSLWEAQRRWGVGNRMRYLLGDVVNYERVKEALSGCNYVFNCAAIKHVPFAEYNPLEATQTNVMGLDNIIKASVEKKVIKLLQISTDKAVEPTTVMGATKMIGEKLLQVRWAHNPYIQMVLVRLGNVYGSRGSIVPIIRRLKEEGKPITITNLNMKRYFMFSDDVTKFIIKAFIEGTNGEIWIPKLRETSLKQLVEDIAGKDYPVKIIGSRRGEKMREKLLSDDEKILSIRPNPNYWIIRNTHPKTRKY